MRSDATRGLVLGAFIALAGFLVLFFGTADLLAGAAARSVAPAWGESQLPAPMGR